MSKNRRSYTPEYKDEAAKMVVELSRPVASVARECGLNEQTLRNWVNVYRETHAASLTSVLAIRAAISSIVRFSVVSPLLRCNKGL